MSTLSALPIDEALPRLLTALEAGTKAVLVAPPGAGKTTRVPLALLAASWRGEGRIIVLEPRRIAARAAAERMAKSLGETLGETVGLRVRFGSKVSARTRIEVVTEGIFTRMVLNDPSLEGIAAVLFDEFHERSLDADFGLALALDAQGGLREDLRILVMSATLDGARIAALLGKAEVVESLGRAYPVATRYIGRDPAKRLEDEMASAILTALREEAGSLLAFLPGAGEIRRVETLLKERIDIRHIDIVPLYGALGPDAQDKAIAPPEKGRRKVVLATSIAETSITIDGVRIVVDCGLARVPRFEPDLGLTRLETVRASRAAADQRRGRAGRTEPGVAYRLWLEAQEGAFPAYATPEILSADLSSLLLDCAAWGIADPTSLVWLDSPPKPALDEARSLLRLLDAIDDDNRITPLGRRLCALPVPVRLGRMIVAAHEQGMGELAALIAVTLSERGLGGDSVDLSHRVERMRSEGGPRAQDARRMARSWLDGLRKTGQEAFDPTQTGAVLALAFPDRIAKARGRNGDYVLANGRGASLDPATSLAHQPYLAVAEISGQAARGRIMSAAPITLDEIEASFKATIQSEDEVTFDPALGGLRAQRIRRLGGLILAEQTLAVPADEKSAQLLAEGALRKGIGKLDWSKAQLSLRHRVNFLRRIDETYPDLADEALAADASWLAPFVFGKTRLSEITAEDLGNALDGLLPYDLRRRVESDLPSHFDAPSGQRHAIDYDRDEPTLSVRLQELFGLAQHPAIARGKIPLVVELLSPAHRPVQITRDLPGFWKGSYQAVKSDLKGRYPRHPWPDDPLAAAPTHRAKPRGT